MQLTTPSEGFEDNDLFEPEAPEPEVFLIDEMKVRFCCIRRQDDVLQVEHEATLPPIPAPPKLTWPIPNPKVIGVVIASSETPFRTCSPWNWKIASRDRTES